MEIPLPTEEQTERFFKFIDKTESCWNWTGFKNAQGYGHFRMKDHVYKAHRVSYLIKYEKIDSDLYIDHLCRNTSCVNPSHLEQVTHKENIIRGDGITASNARKTHCKYGHEFTPENTYQKSMGRECRTCKKLMMREFRKHHSEGGYQ